jgi:hypothetical protein
MFLGAILLGVTIPAEPFALTAFIVALFLLSLGVFIDLSSNNNEKFGLADSHSHIELYQSSFDVF